MKQMKQRKQMKQMKQVKQRWNENLSFFLGGGEVSGS